MNLILRPALAEDAAPIVGWFATRSEEVLWGGGDVPNPLTPNWLSDTLRDERYWVLTDEQDGLVGVFGLDFFTEELRAHLRRFAVAPNFRGQGIGKRLLDDAMRMAQSLGAARLSLAVYGSNPAAKRLYERAGFQIMGKRFHKEDVSGMSFNMQVDL